jgi:alkylhydroperoxidase/carboxymuconolactone decarboxylase family protein YurZ
VAALRREYQRNPARPWGPEMQTAEALSPNALRTMLTYVLASVEGSQVSVSERELICIAIDLNCNHMYEAGLRRHTGAALKAGVTPAQISDVAFVVTWLQRASLR